MKTNALLAFFFFLVALFASTRAEFVYDSNGDKVVSGGTYDLLPQHASHAAIAGVAIQNPADGLSCSFAVVELFNHIGNATKIESLDIPPTKYISTDSPLNISFNPLPLNNCTSHPEWLVTEDLDFGQYAVMVGNYHEFPHRVLGQFYFNPGESNALHHYRLVFCFGETTSCRSVAVKTDDYKNKRLIVAEDQESVDPLVFELDPVVSHISMVV